MESEQYLEILRTAGRLKTMYRHCETERGRRESVADHSWRTALMAMLLSGEEEFRDTDIDRVVRMCLIHDLGEAFTGDIPTFEKNESDEETEDRLLDAWVGTLPEALRASFQGLLLEMRQMQTREARVYKALDKMEALISHDESELSTWLPLEYELQFSYGQEEVRFSEELTAVRRAIDRWTQEKICQEGDSAFHDQ